MESIRQQKISSLIKKELAQIFIQKDGEFFPSQMVTVTRVKVTADLSIAKVALSLFPNMESVNFESKAAEYNSQIRYILAKKVKTQLRKVPELIFFHDDTLDRQEELENALR